MRKILVLLASGAAGCLAPLDDPTLVHDLRIMAMRAEPPDVLVDPDDPRTLLLPPFELSALVADPLGEGRRLAYDWTACPEADGLRCFDAGAAAFPIGAGEATAGVFTATFRPTLQFVQKAIDRDRLKGFGYLPVMVTLRVRTIDGAEEVIGAKRVTATAKLVDGQAANVNPQLLDPTLDDEPWPDDRVPDLAAGTEYEVEPQPPGELEERYVVPEWGLTPKTLIERWQYTFAATAGHFSSYARGGAEDVTGKVEGPLASRWRAIPGDPAGEVTFYLVVRDGRGGEAWAVRRGRLR